MNKNRGNPGGNTGEQGQKMKKKKMTHIKGRKEDSKVDVTCDTKINRRDFVLRVFVQTYHCGSISTYITN